MRILKFVVLAMVLVMALMLGQSASAAGMPDLFLESDIYTPQTPSSGIETIRIKNGGTGDAGQFRVFVLNDYNAQVLHVFNVAKLNSGDSMVFQYKKSCRGRERIVIDAHHTVVETNEGNNIQVVKGPCVK
jgi:subtilase family serine protease